MLVRNLLVLAVVALPLGLTGGCAVTAVADAAVTAAATTVKVGAAVVGATADVARAGVRAVTSTPEQKK